LLSYTRALDVPLSKCM